MEPISRTLEEILERAQRMKQRATTQAFRDSSSQCDCPKCQDTGYILNGWEASECACMAQKRLYRLMKNAMIPDEFQDAEFSTYRVTNATQRLMYESAREYVDHFEEIMN